MRTLILLVTFAIAILVASPVLGNDVYSIRCGQTQVVYYGDLDEDVLRKCGVPDSKGINSWIYYQGSTGRVVFHFGPGGRFRRNVRRIEIVGE
jgi:hypothetical protein